MNYANRVCDPEARVIPMNAFGTGKVDDHHSMAPLAYIDEDAGSINSAKLQEADGNKKNAGFVSASDEPDFVKALTPFDEQLEKVVPSYGRGTIVRFLYYLFCTSRYTFVWTAIWLILHLIDYGSDIYAAVYFHRKHEYAYAWLTIFFVALPSMMSSIHCLVWFYRDRRDKQPAAWFELMAIILQMGPTLKYLQTMQHQYRVYKCTRRSSCYVDQKINAEYDRRMRWLYVVEAALESGPQLFLQYHILLIDHTSKGLSSHSPAQIVSITSSIFSLATFFVSYGNELRAAAFDPETDEAVVSDWRDPVGYIFQLCWRLSVMISRATCIVLFCKEYFVWGLSACVAHVALMLAWMKMEIWNNPKAGRSEVFTGAAFLIDFIDNKPLWARPAGKLASYFGVPEGRAVWFNYGSYYALHIVENTAMISLWAAHEPDSLMRTVLLSVGVCGTWIGLFGFAIPFYLCFFKPRKPKRRTNDLLPEAKTLLE